MKRIHLLRTSVAADAVAGLVAAAGADGLRIGWLDLTADPTAGGPITGLDRAAEAGALRAVAVADGRAVAVKRVAGEPDLRDLLREYFLGCAAVLVRVPAGASPPSVAGVGDLPLLDPADDGWQIVRPAGGSVRLTTAELVGRLRRPRPWSSAS